MKSSFFRLLLVRWLLVLMVSPGLCSAQALPSRMQTALSSLIQSKAIKRGFAANDPRIGSTLQAAGSGIVGYAAAAAVVTAAGVTAPAWVTAAISVGLGVLFSAGISLAIDGVKWLLNSDGSVSVTMSSISSPGAGMVAGGVAYVRGSTYAADPVILANLALSTVPGKTLGDGWYVGTPGASDYYFHIMSADGSVYGIDVAMFTRAAPATCAVGQYYDGTSCLTPAASTPPLVLPGIGAAAANVSDGDKAKPVNPAIVAAIADTAWKQAASQPGYAGLPYDASDPITQADAQMQQQANPASWPTVGDTVSPQVSTDGALSPFSLPSSSGSPSTGTGTGNDTGSNTGSNTDSKPIDWGSFSAPQLEETPTVSSIVDPLLNLWPAWASFSFPQHQSVCPTPSFMLPGGVLNGQTVRFTQMCDFLEANNVRVAMQAAFAVAWAIVIVFIVMGA
ncbi:hypothetical protein NX784_10615 [Massilia pinisoli]|uniref:TspB protein n=1 Tax=Massilia pinisoli TaxID=1772194 RepID=A0ABT1ZQ38_9BURK|nr:hypothetical protein [Massilia pinisoli]MCS0582043.1 hypothetical protein [Massilia pinisoli]